MKIFDTQVRHFLGALFTFTSCMRIRVRTKDNITDYVVILLIYKTCSHSLFLIFYWKGNCWVHGLR
jgi:hypothetical protein